MQETWVPADKRVLGVFVPLIEALNSPDAFLRRNVALVLGLLDRAENALQKLEGTPFEDGPVQVGIIQPGMRLEILADHRRIVTSPVRSLKVASVH